MKVFVTGATGFVGSHVIRALLAHGHTVAALVRPGSSRDRIEDVLPRVRAIEGDLSLLTNAGGMRQLNDFEPDVCVHTAWHTNPADYLRSPANLELLTASVGLAARLREVGCRRLVATGTCFEYDLERGYLSESTPTAPRFLYAACKLALYHVLRQLAQDAGLSFAWARLFYLYGPSEHPDRLVPSVARALLRGEGAPVTTGEQIRDYLHVADAADALCAIAEQTVEDAINVGSGEPVRVSALIGKLSRACGRPELVQFGAITPRPGDPPFVCADVSKLRRATGWRPRFRLQDGLEDTVQWWRQRGSNSGAAVAG